MNRDIPLPESGDVAVGRDASCDITIDDARASRRHATFHVSPGLVTVEDNGSLNGVRVNDVAINGVRTVAHGERVEIGSHVFILMDGERGRRASVSTKSGGSAMTRRVPVASIPRAGGNPLEAIARSLDVGDVAAASRAMEALIPQLARGGEGDAVDLHQIALLLLKLAAQPRCERFFDRIFQIHTARGVVPSGESIDAIRAALPSLAPTSQSAIDAYLRATGTRSTPLTAVEQVRLRRLSSLLRPSNKPGVTG